MIEKKRDCEIYLFSKIGKIFSKTIDKSFRWVYNDTVNSEIDRKIYSVRY